MISFNIIKTVLRLLLNLSKKKISCFTKYTLNFRKAEISSGIEMHRAGVSGWLSQ